MPTGRPKEKTEALVPHYVIALTRWFNGATQAHQNLNLEEIMGIDALRRLLRPNSREHLTPDQVASLEARMQEYAWRERPHGWQEIVYDHPKYQEKVKRIPFSKWLADHGESLENVRTMDQPTLDTFVNNYINSQLMEGRIYR